MADNESTKIEQINRGLLYPATLAADTVLAELMQALSSNGLFMYGVRHKSNSEVRKDGATVTVLYDVKHLDGTETKYRVIVNAGLAP